ncbi:helix-turn-helix domain-containing protein [Anaeromyxobacter terrae]|uniref:helix-turn-helix domain-containing protein n=1 Tax=Anaeromyxobacter terrae TaxID=2925406 RepID=UPI001F59F77F|nr:helix-turn-helix transcriptional regulator [Anaeromyxobacter sp. SG22]
MSTITFPAADLATKIDLCWSVTGEGKGGTAFRELFPDSGAHLVVRFSSSAARMVLLGPSTEKVNVELDEGAEYLGVRFRTGQAPRLADVRPSELTNRFVELTRLGGERVESIAERLRASPDLGSRQRLVEGLLRGDTPPLVRDDRCRRAALLLEGHGGRLRVDDLARALGLHVRSLERLFLEHLGITPKRLARLVRLRQVLGELHAGRHASLAELALACGYSDQPHLVRDFKALTGRTPGAPEAFRNRRLERAQARIVHRYRP